MMTVARPEEMQIAPVCALCGHAKRRLTLATMIVAQPGIAEDGGFQGDRSRPSASCCSGAREKTGNSSGAVDRCQSKQTRLSEMNDCHGAAGCCESAHLR